jgi:spermidine/putrescine transport system ATP-binding protein
MSDRIAVMNRGIVEQVAVPVEVYERPATTFVAGFIGVSNLMPGVVRSLSGDNAVVELDAGVAVEAKANGLGTGEVCHAVVRPEKLFVTPKGQPGASRGDNAQSVDGVVVSSVYLGTATQLVVELRDEAKMTVLCPNTDESERQSLPGGGAEVTLSWTPEHIHLVRESSAERATADHEALARAGGAPAEGKS